MKIIKITIPLSKSLYLYGENDVFIGFVQLKIIFNSIIVLIK